MGTPERPGSQTKADSDLRRPLLTRSALGISAPRPRAPQPFRKVRTEYFPPSHGPCRGRGPARPERRGFPRLQPAMPRLRAWGGISQRKARDTTPAPSARGSGRGPAGDGKVSRSRPLPVALRVSNPLLSASARASRVQLRRSRARRALPQLSAVGGRARGGAAGPALTRQPLARAGEPRGPPLHGRGRAPERMNEAGVGGQRPPERGAQLGRRDPHGKCSRGRGPRSVGGVGAPPRRAGAHPLTSGARQVPADVGRGPESGGGDRAARNPGGARAWGLRCAPRRSAGGRERARTSAPQPGCPPGYRMQNAPLPAASGKPPRRLVETTGCVVGGWGAGSGGGSGQGG